MLTLAGQTMPVGAFSEMCQNLKVAYPQWTFSTTECALQPNGNVRMGTQQTTGPMCADLPACGPFPAVKLDDVPEKVKQGDGLIVPVEIGEFTFDAERKKICKMVWDGSLGDTSKSNTMHHSPPVGMPVLFAEMGVELPPPAAP